MNRCVRSAAALAVFAGLVGAAFAQEAEPGVVSGTGVSVIKRQPERMRLQVALLGRGASLQDALGVLKGRIASAKTTLAELGADKDSIKVEDARITELQSDNRQQMQMMMMQRMKRGGKKASKAQPAPPVIVSAMLTAEWQLSAKDTEELLLAVHPLQEKIKAADLAGSKEAEKLTPEQEEMLEEMQENYGYTSSDEERPGVPTFMFVSRVSEAEREKALAEAYEKARQQAASFARAAGAKIGSLKSLASYSAGSDYDDYGMGGYGSYAYRMMQTMRARQAATGEDPGEAIGTEPGTVSYQVSIVASFDLESKD